MKATNTILVLTKILEKYVDENADFDKSEFKVENWGWKNIKLMIDPNMFSHVHEYDISEF